MQCTGTRKDGERCGAHALTDQELCAGHAGLGIAADPRAYAQAAAEASGRARSERAVQRRETLLERIGRQTEERAAEIVAAYFAAGERGDWRALEALVTRVHGKPVERVEVEAPADPLGVAAMTSVERQALIARLVAQHPHLEGLATGTDEVQH